MGGFTSLFVLLLSMWLFWSLEVLVTAQPPTSIDLGRARALDALLQGYAFEAFSLPRTHPRTGVVYNGVVPSNLTGVQVSAVRLRSGSLWLRGVRMYREFEIPTGVVEVPYVQRLVLVYQNLGNWSMSYYPLQGYMYLAPVLGLLAYDASHLNARNLPELGIQASEQPISVRFPQLRSVPDGSVPRCVLFDLNGTVSFSNVLSNNTCTTFGQGHFAIVVESIAPAPSPVIPVVPVSPPPPPRPPRRPSGGGNNRSSRIGIIVGSVIGGFVLLIILALLVVWLLKYKRRKDMQQMERAADAGEALHMTTVGSTKAPAATGTRTQPTLETEYVP